MKALALVGRGNACCLPACLVAWAGLVVMHGSVGCSGRALRAIEQAPCSVLPAALTPLAADDPRSILVWNRKLRAQVCTCKHHARLPNCNGLHAHLFVCTQVLPVALLSNGHVAFVQRTPWK